MLAEHNRNNPIDVSDRGLNYGDGCFTTMLVRDNQIPFLLQHLQRIEHSCKALGIIPLDNHTIETELLALASSVGSGAIKLLVTRGSGGRGYSPSGATNTNYLITQHPVPHHYAIWRCSGIVLGISRIKLGVQPALAGLKHLNRLEQVLIKRELEQGQVDDVIVLNSDNEVTEVSAANLFWRTGDSWYTPKLTKAGVKGIMRDAILTYFCHRKVAVEKVAVPSESLITAQSVFICNCLMGIVPVRCLELANQNVHFDTSEVLRLQQQISDHYDKTP